MSIDNADDPIQSQYEQWTYPAPISDLSDPKVRGIRDAGDPDVLGTAYWPDRPGRKNLEILVAGCGSNAAARYAFNHRDANVVGIDISEASLAHEDFLKKKHRLDNLSLYQCRIEDISRLARSFDFIDATGVLHHLRDPNAGLKALTSVLRLDGVIYLMLYGKFGRAGIYMLQELFSLLGVQQTPNDVQLVRQSLPAFKQDHVIQSNLAGNSDLDFDAGVVDLFLNSRDRAYTVGDCLKLVHDSSLVLQGWAENFYYYPDFQVPTGSPLFARIDSLPEQGKWQAMELFHGRIPQHRFFACHRSRNPASWRISFDDEQFMDYVPHLHPELEVRARDDGSIVVQRQRFLELNFSGAALKVFLQVDGRRSIRDCFSLARIDSSVSPVPLCRGVFRALWILSYCRYAFALPPS